MFYKMPLPDYTSGSDLEKLGFEVFYSDAEECIIRGPSQSLSKWETIMTMEAPPAVNLGDAPNTKTYEFVKYDSPYLGGGAYVEMAFYKIKQPPKLTLIQGGK